MRYAKALTCLSLLAVALAYGITTLLAHRRPTAWELRAFDAGLPNRGQWRNSFAIADINGDGHLDIVHGPARKAAGPPRVFLGDSQGQWRAWDNAQFPKLNYDYGGIDVADFDGDGRLDIALAVHMKKVLVLEQRAPAIFTPNTSAADALNFSSRRILAKDWNGDGRLDLIALSDGPAMFGKPGALGSTPGIRILLNLPEGWRTASLPAFDEPLFGDALATGDVNGDGLPDLAVGASRMDYRNILRIQTDSGWQARAIDALPAGGVIRALVMRDLNHDGREDMVLAHWRRVDGVWEAAIEVMYAPASVAAPQAMVRRTLWRQNGEPEVSALALGSMRDAQHTDLAALRADGSILLFPGDGQDFFKTNAAPSLNAAPGCRGYHAAFADVDHDGHDELVASFAGESDTRGTCQQGGALKVWKLALR